MSDDLRGEYPFDYRQAKPNRFAATVKKGGRLVVLVCDSSQDRARFGRPGHAR